MLATHEFPAIASPDAFKADYRQVLDRAGETMARRDDVVEEAAVAFQPNIDLSLAVQAGAAVAAKVQRG